MKRLDEAVRAMGYPFAANWVQSRVIDRKLPLILPVFHAQMGLWNDLVKIEAEHTEQYRAIIAGDCSSREATDHAARLGERIDDLITAYRPGNAVDKAALRSANAEWKSARAAAREARHAAREKLKPFVDKNEAERRTAVKAAVKESGLWWGHHEPITERYEVARQQAMKRGVALRPAADPLDIGMLRVRWQAGMPWDSLVLDGDAVAGLRSTFARPREHRFKLRYTIDCERRARDYLECEIVMGRTPPPGAIVKYIVLLPGPVRGVNRWHGTIVVNEPQVAFRPNGRAETLVFAAEDLRQPPNWGNFVLREKGLRWHLEDAARKHLGRNLHFSDAMLLAEGGDGRAKRALAEVAEAWKELGYLRKRWIARRDQYWRGVANELTRAHGLIRVQRQSLAFAGSRPERPAYGRFIQILSASAFRNGCEIELFHPGQEDMAREQRVG